MRGMKFLSMSEVRVIESFADDVSWIAESNVVTPVTVDEGDDVKHGDCC